MKWNDVYYLAPTDVEKCLVIAKAWEAVALHGEWAFRSNMLINSHDPFALCWALDNAGIPCEGSMHEGF